jgi:hypothetical protein
LVKFFENYTIAQIIGLLRYFNGKMYASNLTKTGWATFWAILGNFLGNFGQFWAILGNFWQFLAILDNFGQFFHERIGSPCFQVTQCPVGRRAEGVLLTLRFLH